MRFLPYTAAVAVAAATLHIGTAFADAVKTEHVEAELIAENTALSRGGDNTVALRIVPEKGWHVYWRNPGDSGLPTSLTWMLPEGLTAGDINWPYPHLESLGGIVNYGYSDETLLPVALTVAPDFAATGPVTLKAKAKWLVCKDLCIPGSADLSLSLPVVTDGTPSADERWRQAFSSTREHMPQPAPADWKIVFEIANGAKDKDFSLAITGANITSAGDVSFFPYASDLIQHSSPSRKANDDRQGLRITRTLSDYFVKVPEQVDGVLVLHDGDTEKAWEIHAQPGKVVPVPASQASAAQPAAATPGAVPNLGLVLLFAMLGGVILNLMPCVFPVLSIKAISLVEARGTTARKQRGHALAYTAGVLLTFAGLAAMLLVLRGTGSAIGWGFQLQQPAFVAGLAYLFFAMGLSLSGVVEFGTQLMGVGQSLASSAGYRGSFFTGVLAVAVASPCTAPFMGTALGYALSQPAYVAIAVFLALGFGLALPFLLIGFNPALARLLPRPGKWMETFKQVMAFPLYLTAVWLLWVLGGLTDRNGMTVGLLGCTLIAFALWLWNRPGVIPAMLKFIAIAAAASLLASGPVRSSTAAGPVAKNAAFEPWSEDRIAALRAEGRTVFVNFTADWCITCKVNEAGSLSSDRVRKAFAAQNVAWLEGDWTRSDPAITKTLSQFGRAGVPLYLVYVNGGEPKVLPQVLTPDIVISALK